MRLNRPFGPFPRQIFQSLRHLSDPYPLISSMDPPGFPSSGGSPQPSPPGRREVQLQGPRPSPLRVSKDSHKIRKPPPNAASTAKPPLHPQFQSQARGTTAAASSSEDSRQPVIIYAVSPKVIHADPSNFMSIVQRLTGSAYSGPPASTFSSSTADEFGDGSSAGGPISPAARLASIEKTSTSERTRERERERNNYNNSVDVSWDVMALVEGVDLGQIPGILSPSPSNLAAISTGLFSPAVDMQALFGVQDVLSPLMFGHNFLSSPSGFLSSSVAGFSPSLSPTIDLASLFGDRF
ncbi:hypothetical protein Dimus_013767 [Dionaea muscipula]